MGILPHRRSKGWIILAWCYWIVITLLLWLNRFVVSGQEFSAKFAFRFALLAFFLAIVVNGLAWLGARWVWLITSIGIAVGFLLMFHYANRDMSGWDDLASMLGFMVGVVIGFGAGLIAEIINYVIGLRRKNRG